MTREEEIRVTIDTYNNTIEDYEAHTRNLGLLEALNKFANYVEAKGKVLDLGCGWGRDAHLFYEKGFEVYGVDLSEKMINRARELYTGISFEIQDIRNLNFENESFDGIWASACLLHIPKSDLIDVLRNLHKILKPGGHIFVSVKEKLINQLDEEFTPDFRYDGSFKFWSYFELDEMLNYLKNTHFEILESVVRRGGSSYSTNPWIEIICSKPYSGFSNL